jgi:hypothetical protein
MLDPFTRIWKRVENSKNDSDLAVFMDLMYVCEQMTKIVALGLIVACLLECLQLVNISPNSEINTTMAFIQSLLLLK